MDRVVVMTCLYPMPKKVCTLNASGSIARQHLLEDIMLHSLPQMSLPRLSRNDKGAIRKLKAMPLNPTRYLQADRTVHFFLLSFQLDDGVIDLPPEVFV